MKAKADLVRGWVPKARSDLLAMDASRAAGSLDTCCFHAQQPTEKLLKDYLIHRDVEFPFTHDLAKFLELAAQQDAGLLNLKPAAETLTPYAVQLRYDDDFWPGEGTADEARALAKAACDSALSRLPSDVANAGPAGDAPA